MVPNECHKPQPPTPPSEPTPRKPKSEKLEFAPTYEDASQNAFPLPPLVSDAFPNNISYAGESVAIPLHSPVVLLLVVNEYG